MQDDALHFFPVPKAAFNISNYELMVRRSVPPLDSQLALSPISFLAPNQSGNDFELLLRRCLLFLDLFFGDGLGVDARQSQKARSW